MQECTLPPGLADFFLPQEKSPTVALVLGDYAWQLTVKVAQINHKVVRLKQNEKKTNKQTS